jgi:hypothetical protein
MFHSLQHKPEAWTGMYLELQKCWAPSSCASGHVPSTGLALLPQHVLLPGDIPGFPCQSPYWLFFFFFFFFFV